MKMKKKNKVNEENENMLFFCWEFSAHFAVKFNFQKWPKMHTK